MLVGCGFSHRGVPAGIAMPALREERASVGGPEPEAAAGGGEFGEVAEDGGGAAGGIFSVALAVFVP